MCGIVNLPTGQAAMLGYCKYLINIHYSCAEKTLDALPWAVVQYKKELPLCDGGLLRLLQNRTVNHQDLAVSVFSSGFPASRATPLPYFSMFCLLTFPPIFARITASAESVAESRARPRREAPVNSIWRCLCANMAA
jgi:hypothetical protein